MKKSQLLLLALLFVFTMGIEKAHANIWIEPYAGYSMGGVKSSKISTDEDANGSVFGGRLGWGMLGIYGGVQFDNAALTTKLPNSSGSGKVSRDMNVSNVGAFVNVSLPILFRFWGTYIFSSESAIKNVDLDLDGTGGTSSTNGKLDLKGKGTELGIGFTGLPFLSINASYINIKYDDNSHPDFAVSSMKLNDLEYKGYMLSVSIPLSF